MLALSSEYDVLFLQGGASAQFSMLPTTSCPKEKQRDMYTVVHGRERPGERDKRLEKPLFWLAEKISSLKSYLFLNNHDISKELVYVHLTSNETIGGIQYKTFPDSGDIPLVADMSRDIMSRPFDTSRFSLIYAGAQKNLGAAGVTICHCSPWLVTLYS
ncbi:Phosphoserine aminotransferase [compost metagenome]